MSVEEMSVEKMSVEDMSVEKMSVEDMSVGMMSVQTAGHLSVEEMRTVSVECTPVCTDTLAVGLVCLSCSVALLALLSSLRLSVCPSVCLSVCLSV